MEIEKVNLRELRVLNGNLNQAEAGQKVGVSGDVWGNWERGVTFPNVPQIQRIEEAFNVSYNDIIFLTKKTV